MPDTLLARLVHASPFIGTTVALIGSVVWLLWPADPWTLNPEAILAVLIAGGAWISVWILKPPMTAESRPMGVPRLIPHPHDLQLFALFNDTFSPAERAFLREHTLRNQIDSSWLEGTEVVASWRGADYEFHDEALQTCFRRVQARAYELMDLTGRYLFAKDNNPSLLSPLTDFDREKGVSEQTYSHVREMDAKLAEFIAESDNLIRLARDRLQINETPVVGG